LPCFSCFFFVGFCWSLIAASIVSVLVTYLSFLLTLLFSLLTVLINNLVALHSRHLIMAISSCYFHCSLPLIYSPLTVFFDILVKQSWSRQRCIEALTALKSYVFHSLEKHTKIISHEQPASSTQTTLHKLRKLLQPHPIPGEHLIMGNVRLPVRLGYGRGMVEVRLTANVACKHGKSLVLYGNIFWHLTFHVCI